MKGNDYILEVKNLTKSYPVRGALGNVIGENKAVNGVSFKIERGKTLGLVGESGCGKSTTGRSILRLIEKTSGEVLFNGEDVYSYRYLV